MIWSSTGAENHWDPYPFILLNLFLSMMAGVQAPVIMMSQNRQVEIDQKQSKYVAEAILRNEHQTRLVDAKVDHLVSYQWKRLLEIQEIQIHLLELQIRHVHQGSKNSNKPTDGLKPAAVKTSIALIKKPWTVETQPDGLTRMLLRHYFELDTTGDIFVFAHWHQDADNFTATVEQVEMDITDRNISQITFSLIFPGQTATLDDVFTGEGTVSLRNDFNMEHMRHLGRISSVSINFKNGSSVKFANGELPPRYKPAFARTREDRITDLWKLQLRMVCISYIPPMQVAIVDVDAGMVLRGVTATVFPRVDGSLQRTNLFVAQDTHPEHINASLADRLTDEATSELLQKRIDFPLVYGAAIVGSRPLAPSNWSQILHYEPEIETSSVSSQRPSLLQLGQSTKFSNELKPLDVITALKGPMRYVSGETSPTTLLRSFRRISKKGHKDIPLEKVSVESARMKPVERTPTLVSSSPTGGAPKNSNEKPVLMVSEPTVYDGTVLSMVPVTIEIEREFSGPGTYIFFTDDSRIGFHGELEPIA